VTTTGETAATRWQRRAITLTAFPVACGLLLATAPVWIVGAWVADRLRPGWAALGLLLMAQSYLLHEVAGIAASGWIWVSGYADPPERRAERNKRLQAWWASSLMRSAQRWLAFEIEIEGADALDGPAPLLFLRHASLLDTLLPACLLTARRGHGLRYVLKRELLWDACLDLNGNRLPNYFVRRGSGDSEAEIAAVVALLDDLRGDGVVIYPEGTRFTPRKRARVIQRFHEQGREDLARRAELLQHTLPPRPGGPLALLAHNPGLDVVFGAHVGLEVTASLTALLRGALRGRTVRVGFWRVPYAELPREASQRERWLFEHWRRIDAWVEAHGAPSPRREQKA
jgi:1-acyl-sn-glycerol-3-phosphate acyltransferase